MTYSRNRPEYRLVGRDDKNEIVVEYYSVSNGTIYAATDFSSTPVDNNRILKSIKDFFVRKNDIIEVLDCKALMENDYKPMCPVDGG